MQEIKISGIKTVSEKEILYATHNILNQKKFGFLKSKNYFLFSELKMQASLLASFPKIASVEVKKTAKNLDIALLEREMVGIWCHSDSCFYFDKTGVIFEEAPKSYGSLILVIQDERNLPGTVPGKFAVGDSMLTKKQVGFFEEAHGFISRNFEFSVTTFVLKEHGESEILTSEGWRILLDKNKSASYQLPNLKYVLDEEVKTRRGELEYVDLRLGNKVYYKFRGPNLP